MFVARDPNYTQRIAAHDTNDFLRGEDMGPDGEVINGQSSTRAMWPPRQSSRYFNGHIQ
jgi:hypothetical protein